MSATQFTVDRRDLRFVLNEQLEMVETLGGHYPSLDGDIVESFIDMATEVASDIIFPANAAGDHQGCSFDGNGNVRTPEGYTRMGCSC